MSTPARRAAQYVRMSTDRQDLSPLIQKDAIARFATANGFEVVRSYEDEGRSGVQLANRPRLRQLLRDVADGAPFTEILVYDISRWGRFQDADAAAYYEYHCRMNGVQVIYVGETFDNDLTPASVLLKSMRRVMAAEYSRDIASKSRAGQSRVISMGFHMGALPPFGYRRCSVSADGQRRTLLEHGDRKLALTDRIEWVLGPEEEVALVRRICRACCAGLPLDAIASLVHAEGWRTEKDRPVSTRTIKTLLTNEALIGNFVWGGKSKGGKVIKSAPSRLNASVPRMIDHATWSMIESRLAVAPRAAPPRAPDAICAPVQKLRKPRQLRLAFGASRGQESSRQVFGPAQNLRDQTREFGRALCTALRDAAFPAAFDPRTSVMTLWGARVRIRLMWPSSADGWLLERCRSGSEVQHVLVARMKALQCPIDFFLLPSARMRTAFPCALEAGVPRSLSPYWCQSPAELLGRLAKISALPRLTQAAQSRATPVPRTRSAEADLVATS